MKEIKSLKQLVEKIWEVENSMNLIDFQINSVKIWQYLRFRIFNVLAQKLSIYEQAHTKKTGFKDILTAVPSLFYYSVFSNPLSGSYQKDVLIFNAGRKVNVDGKYIDIYSESFADTLDQNSFEIIDELYLNKHLSKKTKNRKHQDFQQIRTFIKSKLSGFHFQKNDLEFILKIEDEIQKKVGVDIALQKLFLNGFKNFTYDFEFYNKLIKKRKPKKVYLVCSYGYKMALVAAAKQNRVEVIELQHGTMNKYHMGYSYPNSKSIDYFPDKFLFFGTYWKNCMHYPIDTNNSEIIGFQYFLNQKSRYNSIEKKKDSITVISQGTIGEQLSKLLFESIGKLENYTLTIKLHPGEFDRWQTEYPLLVKLAEKSNVRVSDDFDTNLYSLLAGTEYVIGVYSTALYEALSFSCKVILANLPGVEYLEDLIESGYVKLAKNSDELIQHLGKNDFKKFDSRDFFG